MDQKRSCNREDYDAFLSVLPNSVQSWIPEFPDDEVIELVLDEFRPPEVRTCKGHAIRHPKIVITSHDIDRVLNDPLVVCSDSKNRYNIGNTLHRISVLVDLEENPIGMTIRIGRTYNSGVLLFQDILDREDSLLIIGPPGSGKSSRLREICRYIATDMDKRLMIVDTSNEIAGGDAKPHYSVGDARRIMVPRNRTVHDCMLEAIENHMPEYIVVDEVSSRKEAMAIQSISERGVKIIATAHGNTLSDVTKNPEINYMLGRIKSVTVGDMYAKAENDGNKIKLEREFSSSFATAVELQSFDTAQVHHDIELAIDMALKGMVVKPEVRNIAAGSLRIINGASFES